MKKITLLLFLLTVSFGFAQAPTIDPTTPPVRNAVDVVSIFSGEYSNITGANYNPNWGQSGFGTANTAYDTGSGNLVLAYPDFGYQGVEFGSNQMVSAMEFIHIDIWTDGGVAPNFFLISPGGNETAYAIPNVAGAWQSFDIPLSNFSPPSGVVDLTQVFQFKFDGGDTTQAIYVDNLYFWKNPAAAGTDATLSDLQVDNATVAGFTANTANYTIGLIEGTTVVPQITSAMTTDMNAMVTTITQAPGIPGDATVLVTAADGTTTMTYTVSFAITSPSGAAPTPPLRNAVDVVSLFSDAYSNITLTELPTTWSDTGFEAITLDGTNNTWRLTDCEFLGMVSNYGPGTDLSAMEFMHIDYWAASNSSNELLVKIVNTISGGEDIQSLGAPSVTGSWQSVDIDMSLFVGNLANKAEITQILIDSNGRAPEFYIDNFYFFKGMPLSTNEFITSSYNVFPNPTSNNWNVKSTQNINSVVVFDILGKQVLTLTPNAQDVVIDASTLNSGLYFARINSEAGIKTVKLVKE